MFEYSNLRKATVSGNSKVRNFKRLSSNMTRSHPYVNEDQICRHMLMSALPMTQFWSAGSSAHQYSRSPTVAFTLVRLANETALGSSCSSNSI